MKKRSSAAARTLAAIAVIGGFVLVLVIVVVALNGSGDSSTTDSTGSGSSHHTVPAKDVPKVYVVKYGDTLTAIAHSTGVSVARIQRLNPTVDPQILRAGEQIKLR